MDPSDTQDLIDALLSGAPNLAALAGLGAPEIQWIAHLGATSLQGQRFDEAIAIFTALEQLDPGDALHTLHRAVAEAKAGKRAEALASCTRFLEEEDAPAAAVIEAIELRITLQDDERAARIDRAALAQLRAVAR